MTPISVTFIDLLLFILTLRVVGFSVLVIIFILLNRAKLSKKQLHGIYTNTLIAWTILCIFSIVPFFIYKLTGFYNPDELLFFQKDFGGYTAIVGIIVVVIMILLTRSRKINEPI